MVCLAFAATGIRAAQPGNAVVSVPPSLITDALSAKEAFEQGQFLDCQKIYEKMLTQAPDNVYILSNLGVVYFRNQQFKLAEDSLKKAVAVAPEDTFSWCTLGIVYYQEKRYADALGCVNRALAINPRYQVAQEYKYVILQLIHPGAAVPPPPGDENPQHAPSDGVPPGEDITVPPSLMQDARDARTTWDHGWYHDCQKIYEGMLTQSPDNLYILSNLGVVYFRNQEWNLAETTLRKALAINPRDALSLVTLSAVYYRENQFNPALKCVNLALSIDPQDRVALTWRFIIYQALRWDPVVHSPPSMPPSSLPFNDYQIDPGIRLHWGTRGLVTI